MAQFTTLPQHIFYSQLKYPIDINLSSASAHAPKVSDYIEDDKILDFFQQTPLTYTPVEGSIGVRESIASLYNKVKIEEISVFTGAQEAIFSTYSSLLNQGDEVIVITPCYQNLNHYLKDFKIKFVPCELNVEDSWKLSLEKLEELITNKTKLISINYPHNPTGAHLSHKELKEFIDLVSKHNLYVLSDEVSSFSVYDQRDFWCLSECYEKAISISVMSKSFGLSGLRIGWAICKDKSLLRKMSMAKTYLSTCSSIVDEFLCEHLLKSADQILSKNNELIVSNINSLELSLSKKNWVKPQAGIVCVVKTRRDINLIVEDLSRQGILIVPGHVFGLAGDYFRLGLGGKDLLHYLSILEEDFF